MDVDFVCEFIFRIAIRIYVSTNTGEHATCLLKCLYDSFIRKIMKP